MLLRRWRPRDIVDAIEANALHGGRMSLSDSLRLTVLTVLSAGVGASVGLEAAFTQLGSGTASRLGRMLHLRRGDLRDLCRLRRCGGDRRRLQRAARRRVLRLRADHRQLHAGDAGRRSSIAAVFATLVIARDCSARRRSSSSYAPCRPASRGHYVILAVIGIAAAGAGDRRDARRDLDRAMVAPPRAAALGAARRVGGADPRRVRAGLSAGPRQRPRRHPQYDRDRLGRL